MRRKAKVHGERDPLTGAIIGAAIEVHKALGPGLSEKLYHNALCIELAHKGMRFESELTLPILYRGKKVGSHRLDLLVENTVVVELKSVSQLMPVHEAQLFNYLRLSKCRVGLVINFDVIKLVDGVLRRVL